MSHTPSVVTQDNSNLFLQGLLNAEGEGLSLRVEPESGGGSPRGRGRGMDIVELSQPVRERSVVMERDKDDEYRAFLQHWGGVVLKDDWAGLFKEKENLEGDFCKLSKAGRENVVEELRRQVTNQELRSSGSSEIDFDFKGSRSRDASEPRYSGSPGEQALKFNFILEKLEKLDDKLNGLQEIDEGGGPEGGRGGNAQILQGIHLLFGNVNGLFFTAHAVNLGLTVGGICVMAYFKVLSTAWQIVIPYLGGAGCGLVGWLCDFVKSEREQQGALLRALRQMEEGVVDITLPPNTDTVLRSLYRSFNGFRATSAAISLGWGLGTFIQAGVYSKYEKDANTFLLHGIALGMAVLCGLLGLCQDLRVYRDKERADVIRQLEERRLGELRNSEDWAKDVKLS